MLILLMFPFVMLSLGADKLFPRPLYWLTHYWILPIGGTVGRSEVGRKEKLGFRFLLFFFSSLEVRCFGSGCTPISRWSVWKGWSPPRAQVPFIPSCASCGRCSLQPLITGLILLPLSVLPVFQHLCDQFPVLYPLCLKHLAWFLFPWLNPHPSYKQGSHKRWSPENPER